MSRKSRLKQPAPVPLGQQQLSKPGKGGAGKKQGGGRKGGPQKGGKPVGTNNGPAAPSKGRNAGPAPKRKPQEESDEDDDFEIDGASSEEEQPVPKKKTAPAAAAKGKPVKGKPSPVESESEEEEDEDEEDDDDEEMEGDSDDGAMSDDSFGDADNFESATDGEDGEEGGEGSDDGALDDEFDGDLEGLENDDDEASGLEDGDEEDEESGEDDEDDEELQTNIAETQKFVLPSGQEIEKDAMVAPDLALVQQRIQDVIRVLGNFKELREEGRPRTEYVDRLLKDLALYYGYSEFMIEKLFHLFTPPEVRLREANTASKIGWLTNPCDQCQAVAFFEANEVPRPVVIRTNTLKTRRRDLVQALINRGVNLDSVGKWSKVGLQVFDSSVPIGELSSLIFAH